MLNEAQARWYVADKALDLGRGGVSRLARVTGMSRTTMTKAIAELRGRTRLIAAHEPPSLDEQVDADDCGGVGQAWPPHRP